MGWPIGTVVCPGISYPVNAGALCNGDTVLDIGADRGAGSLITAGFLRRGR